MEQSYHTPNAMAFLILACDDT